MPENYLTAILVLLFVVGMLLVYLLMESATDRARMWKDAYHNEVESHDQTRELLTMARHEILLVQDDAIRRIDALRDSHAQLQEEFLAQGRELTLALAKAKAAERVE